MRGFKRPVVLKTTLQPPLPPERVMVQFTSAPVMLTVPVGVTPPPVTLKLTMTAWPGLDGLGVWAVMVVEVEPKLTVWLAVPVLVEKLASPAYVAVRVLLPMVVKTTLQLPVPPASNILQLLSAPVILTMPVGIGPDPLTVTLTTTPCPGVDESGISLVMVVVDEIAPVDTV